MPFPFALSCLLFSLFGYVGNDRSVKLIEASGRGDLVEVRSLLAQGADVDYIYPDKSESINALHAACGEEHVDVVRCLVEHGANIEATIAGDGIFAGLTPLHIVCAIGNLEIVQYLIEQGANRKAKTPCGHSVLKVAMRGLFYDAPNPEVIKYLLTLDGVDEELDFEGLFSACSVGHLEVVEHFVTKNPHLLHETDEDGETLLHVACSGGSLDMVKLLIAAGANIEAQTAAGTTPLLSACFCNNFDIVQYLVEQGASIHVCDARGRTPYDVAHKYGYRKIINYLALLDNRHEA